MNVRRLSSQAANIPLPRHVTQPPAGRGTRRNVLCRFAKFLTYDGNDANFLSAFLNLLAASMAITALASDDWLWIGPADLNATAASSATALEREFIFDFPVYPLQDEPCRKIGARDFYRAPHFGGYMSDDQRMHVVFHSGGRVLLDCISPSVANYFYIQLAVAFLVVLIASAASFLHVLAPPAGFLAWLRRNTLLEMCCMILTLLACICALLAQNAIQTMRPDDEINIGPGLFLVSLAGLMCFVAAAASIRHWARIQRARRVDNQRLMCPRSLRSWRDVYQRRAPADDTLPIVDFESYLDCPKLEENILAAATAGATNKLSQHPPPPPPPPPRSSHSSERCVEGGNGTELTAMPSSAAQI